MLHILTQGDKLQITVQTKFGSVKVIKGHKRSKKGQKYKFVETTRLICQMKAQNKRNTNM